MDEETLRAAFESLDPIASLRDAAATAGLTLRANPFAGAREWALAGLRAGQ